MRRHAVIVGLLASAMLLAIPAAVLKGQQEGVQAQSPTRPQNHVYIVRLGDAPVVSYTGGIAGYAATKPARGSKLNPLDPDVVRYAAMLAARHDTVLNTVGGGRKLYSYPYSFNGFAAELTEAQAAAIEAVSGVVAVSPDEMVWMDTTTTPTFLGLTDPGGLWDQLGGVDSAGEGLIIGMIDSGIWPESLSFSDRTGLNGNATQDGKLSYQQIPGWHGKCTPGEAFNASMCNQKLIGAQWFNAGWGDDAGIEAQRPWEFASARDYNGHGTHTSSTAGGNHAVPVTGPAAAYGTINGIAPRARIAMYKALWSTEDASTASGYTSDLVAAIDQAVADGVDVISYSISGTTTNFLNSVELAFLSAADAGVFVAAAAGNAGASSTVNHPSPWITTVAAGTHNRTLLGTATLGNGSAFTGASVSPFSAGPAPLIESVAAGLPGADPIAVSLCFSAEWNGAPVLDPTKVAGRIVVCDRGTNDRVDKSLAVKEAGGVGMILVNVPPSPPNSNTLSADYHSVPTVHLSNTHYAVVHAYAATVGATATISKARIDLTAPAPFTASFSSRGPLPASGDLLKPDVMAPGQDIMAAVAPPGNGGQSFALYSGTSMSTPHVAGLAALLKNLHPDWTPMMVKSALMTTGSDVVDAGISAATMIFRQGAGHVKPNNAADPGLVLNSGFNDWLGFLCGTQLAASYCTSMGVPVLDPSDFNAPSIAIAEWTNVQTVTRKVTNVGNGTATYTASYTGMTGFTLSISPLSLTLNRGETKSFSVTFTRTTAAFSAYAGGQLTWTDGTHNVRIPMVVRPLALLAPTQVSSNGAPISYNVTFGYSGSFTATARGLLPATTFDGSVSTDPSGTFVRGGPGTISFDVIVPGGATYARFSLFDANTTPGSDLDLYVYRGNTQVGASARAGSNEEVNLLNPTAATYTVWVHGYATADPSTFTLFTWALGSTAAGNMAVSAPATASLGATGTINLTFTGLTAGTKYLGSVAYGGVVGLPNPTIVRIDP